MVSPGLSFLGQRTVKRDLFALPLLAKCGQKFFVCWFNEHEATWKRNRWHLAHAVVETGAPSICAVVLFNIDVAVVNGQIIKKCPRPSNIRAPCGAIDDKISVHFSG